MALWRLTAQSNMAVCIVCNQKTSPGDLQNVADLAKLCARLEKVLDEAVPEGSVMCASCKFDLSQIETYYTLLAVFKKRYSATAQQRSKQNQTDEASTNLLHETTDCSSENLQNLFGATDASENDGSHLPLHSEIVAGNGSPGISSAVAVPIVKEEFPLDTSVETPSNNSVNSAEMRHQDLDPVPFPFAAPRKLGRPRKNVQTPFVAALPKKRGRPRKNIQASPGPSMANKQGRPGKNVSSSSAATGGSAVSSKKRGRPRKSESANTSQAGGSTELQTGDLGNEQSESQTSIGGDSEMPDLVQVKLEAHEPTDFAALSDNTVADNATTVSKKKLRNPKKDQDPGYEPVTQKSAGRRKRERPKKEKPQPPFTCPVCNKVFDDRYRFKAHTKLHSDERPYVCSVCGKAFKDSSYLKGHMKIHSAEKNFKCEVCGKAFLVRKTMQRHALVHTDLRPYPCDQCDQRFKSADRLKYHFRLAHVQGRKFLCSICGTALYTANTLRIHMTSHSAVKPFQCPTCGKGYVTKQALLTHQTSHTEAGRIKHLCPICGKSFSNKSYLAPHIRQHTGESTHFCSVCNKSCMTGHAYRRHMLIHQDNKPHQCTQCGKRFKVLSNLNQHMISHSEERPFVCDCGKAFNRKYKLQRHMLTKIHAEFEAKSGPARASNVALAAPDPAVVPNALSIGLPVPVVVAAQPPAPPMSTHRAVPTDRAVSTDPALPLVVDNQQEQLYVVEDDTAPVYLALYHQEVVVEHVA